MADVRNTPLLLHGIGKGVLKTVNGDVLELTTSQSMTVNVTTSTEDVYGGDGLFPIFNYLTQKEGSIEITDAAFKLSQLNIAQGTKVTTSGNKRMVNYRITSADSQLGTSSITGFEATAVVAPDGSNVEVETATGTSGMLCINSTGAVDWSDISVPMSGEYSVWGLIDDTKTVTAEMLKEAVCDVASFSWSFQTVDQAGAKYQIDLFARRVRANGEFSIETSRDSASTPSLTVTILDPGDGRSDFMTISITKL